MEEFQRRLREPGAHVMIIGYGFGDDHINLALEEAAKGGGLKAFIIDPAGADAPDPDLRKSPLIPGKPGPKRYIQRALVGASRRSLSRIFGDDKIERDKVLRFFEPKPGAPRQAGSD